MRVLVPVLMSLVWAACASTTAALPQTDIDAIRAASRGYVQTALAGDWAKWKTHLEPDVKVMVPNLPVMNGAADAEKWALSFPPAKALVLEPIEIEGVGNMANVRGRYSLVLAPPGQPEVADSGKYVEIWRKQTDGSWKMHWSIFNSDLPLPAPPAATAPPAPAKKN